MAMDKTKAIQKESDARLRVKLTEDNGAGVQLDPRINKQRNQVCRSGLGKSGNASA